MQRLAIIITHPIQYHAPLFRLITARKQIGLRVFYTKPKESLGFDQAFGRTVSWDIPLLEGYAFEFTPADTKAHLQLLIRSIEAYDPQAVLVFGWNPPGHLRLMRYFKGKCPVWFRGDSTLLDEQPGWRTMARRLFLKWVYRYVDKAFYVGSANRHYFLKHGLQEAQLAFAPHAIDNDRFAGNDQQQEEVQARAWRQKLGIAADDFAVLFAGKLEAKKAPQLLMEAIIGIAETQENPVHLIMGGSGELEERLRERAQGLPYVHFIGFQNQSQMPVVYRLGEVFCLPSNGPGETWGLAVNEALASGRPVIVSDQVGCQADLVIPQKTGEVFPAGNADALKEKILWMKKHSGKAYTASDLKAHIEAWSFQEQAKAYEQELGKIP